MLTPLLFVFIGCLIVSTAWWILSDFFDKRQTYWYNAWQKCNSERGYLELQLRIKDNNSFYKNESDRVKQEADRVKQEADKIKIEADKLKTEINDLKIQLEKCKKNDVE